MKQRWLIGLLTMAVVVLAPVVVQAQVNTGDIYGSVMDESGGVLPGVTVTLTGSLIGTLTQTTGINGDFHFIRLSPGDYDLQCELDGFATHVQKQIRVETNANVNLKVTMKPTTVSEVVTVVAEQPILDTKKTGVGQNITQEVLANIPTSRDPWVVLSMVSGITVDRVNVAGSEGGQQSEFTSRGDVGGDNSMWNMDGVTITDMAAVGSSPTYYDFDAFEEIQVTTGGNDPAQATGGMGINFVTKRGGDIPKGSARFYTTSEGLQSDNTKDLASATNPGGETTLEGFKWNSAFKRPILFKSRDYGIELGGPIVKEKAWYWGAVGVQDIQTIAVNGAPDNTQLENISLKFNTQPTESNGITYMYYRGDKIKRGRNAGATRPVETTWNQSGPTNIHKVEVSHIVNPNFYLNGKFGVVKGGFSLTPQGGLEKSAYQDTSRVWHNSFLFYSTDRPQYQATIDSNYFLNAMGGNHEFKFGFSYRRTDTESISQWPGNGAYGLFRTGYALAIVTSYGNTNVRSNYLSFYGGDTFTRDRLTMNLGFRFDRQTGSLLDAASPASAIIPSLIPAVNVSAKDAPFKWSNIYPRLGVTYDVSGDGKTIARANFSMYADQLSAGDIAQLSPIPYAHGLIYFWDDTNGNKVVEPSELPDYYIATYYFDPNDPNFSAVAFDSGLKAARTTEFIAGGEREIMPNFSLGGNFVYRKRDQINWTVGTDYKNPNAPYTFNDYVLEGYIEGTLPDGTAYKVPYYRLSDARQATPNANISSLTTNRPDYYQRYMGLELFATKRLSDKWMLNASFNWQRDRGYATSNAGLLNPQVYGDGEDLAFQSGSSGKSGYWIATPKWQFNLNGLYQLPYGVSVSANLISREGYPVVYHQIVESDETNVAEKDIRAVKIYDRKLPNMVEFDFRVSKAVSLGDKGNLMLDLDVFNVLNKNTPLHVQEDLDAGSLNQVADLLYPRTVRFGVRYTF